MDPPNPTRRWRLVSPHRWHLWSLSTPVLVYVLLVEIAAVAAVAATIPSIPVTQQHWIWFGLLVLAEVTHLEAARGMERVRELAAEGAPHTHLQSVWFFAAVLLLSPPLIAALVVVSYLHSWIRVYRRRALAYRKIFSGGTVVLACMAAYGILAVIYPGRSESFATALDGPAGLAAVLAAAVLYRLVNYGMVVAVILATNLDRPARHALGSTADHLMLSGAVGLGAGIGVVMVAQPWWTPLLIVTVLALHTGLLMPHFRDVSRTDSKTGLFEPAFWSDLLTGEIERAQRLSGTVGIVLLDLDHFKRINDAHGHMAGDTVLRAVADGIKHSVRGHDAVGRYGGEEFAVVMPGLDAAAAVDAAERVRLVIAELEVTVHDLDGNPCTISGLSASAGVAVYPDHGLDRTSLLLAADAALYGAKTSGRNSTQLAGGPDTAAPDLPEPSEPPELRGLPKARQPRE